MECNTRTHTHTHTRQGLVDDRPSPALTSALAMEEAAKAAAASATVARGLRSLHEHEVAAMQDVMAMMVEVSRGVCKCVRVCVCSCVQMQKGNARG